MVAEELSPLLEEIDTLLSEPPDGDDAVARMEQTLTDGYARALELEAERWRIERRLAEVVRLVAGGSGNGAAAELAVLSGRLEVADADLRLLRDRLGSLRRVAAAVRSA